MVTRGLNNISPGRSGNRGQTGSSRWFYGGIAATATLLVLVGAYLFFKGNQRPPFSKDVTSSINFPWYYPDALPAEGSIQAGSLEYKNGVLLFVVSLPQGKIVFNEQALPPGDIDNDFLKGQRHATTNLGSDVQIKAAAPGFTGSIQTPTTLIFANTRDSIDADTFVKVVQHFKRY